MWQQQNAQSVSSCVVCAVVRPHELCMQPPLAAYTCSNSHSKPQSHKAVPDRHSNCACGWWVSPATTIRQAGWQCSAELLTDTHSTPTTHAHCRQKHNRRVVNGLQVLIAKGRQNKRRGPLQGNYAPVHVSSTRAVCRGNSKAARQALAVACSNIRSSVRLVQQTNPLQGCVDATLHTQPPARNWKHSSLQSHSVQQWQRCRWSQGCAKHTVAA